MTKTARRTQRMSHEAFRLLWARGWSELWIEQQLQRAYDLMWDGCTVECDEVCASLPAKRVEEMFGAWMDDQDFHDRDPGMARSRWY